MVTLILIGMVVTVGDALCVFDNHGSRFNLSVD